MTKYSRNWLDKELSHWVDKGWITKDAQQHIRGKYGLKKSRYTIAGMPLYLIMSVIGLAVLVLALIWVAAYGWYHINVSIKLAIAVILLIVSQAAVGTVMFQEKQGTLLSEGIGLVHCAIVFIALALVEQAFYTGWNMVSYILAASILILPAVYLLRSIGVVAWYYAAALCWASMDGAINVLGGVSLIWPLIILTIPFYGVLVREKSEFRLAVFSWVVTIAVFGAFGVSVRSAGYVPFLMLSALASVMLLTGYSIDIRKAWGIPFRWFGRLAAAGALLFSCMPASWLKILPGNDIHWLSVVITVGLFALMIVIYVKWLKKRLWSPTIYSLIPILLAVESVFVHNGSESATAMIMSVLYMVFLGAFEIGHGFQNNSSRHIKWGIFLFFCLIASFFIGYQISPVVPVIAIILLCFIVWKVTQYLKKRNLSMLQKARKVKQQKMNHTITAVHSGQAIQAPQDTAVDAVPEWLVEEPARPARKKVTPRPTVVAKPPQESLFTPPVFHEPDEMPVSKQDKSPIIRPTTIPAKETVVPPQRVTSSPWADMPERPKREKHFTKSPWSQEGESRK